MPVIQCYSKGTMTLSMVISANSKTLRPKAVTFLRGFFWMKMNKQFNNSMIMRHKIGFTNFWEIRRITKMFHFRCIYCRFFKYAWYYMTVYIYGSPFRTYQKWICYNEFTLYAITYIGNDIQCIHNALDTVDY